MLEKKLMEILWYRPFSKKKNSRRNTWNFLDFTIVMIGFFDIFLSSMEIEGFDAKVTDNGQRLTDNG